MAFLAQQPWIAITLGTVFVALGGLLATWGWNQSSEIRNRASLIEAVTQEWKINDAMIEDDLSLARRWSTRGDREHFSRRAYKSARLNALISSSALNDGRMPLFIAATQYERAIGEMDTALRIAGRHTPGIYLKVDLIHDPPAEMPLNEQELLSEVFLRVIAAHREIAFVEHNL